MILHNQLFSYSTLADSNQKLPGAKISATDDVTPSVPSRSDGSNYHIMISRHNTIREQYKLTNKDLIDMGVLDHKTTFNEKSPLFDSGFIEKHIMTKQMDSDHLSVENLKRRSVRSWIQSHEFSSGTGQLDVHITRGVRHSIELIMRSFKELPDTNCVFYVPSDVYPVYEQIAKNVGVQYSIYNTIDELGHISYKPFFESTRCTDTPTSGDPEIVIVAIPSPFTAGRKTDASLVDSISLWLSERENRYVIIDSVYSSVFEPVLERLMISGKAFYLNSLSKSHCSPNLFGVLVCPNLNVNPNVDLNINNLHIPSDVLLKADALMNVYPHRGTMDHQRSIYSKTWRSIEGLINTQIGVVPKGLLSDTNYVRLYRCSESDLLKKDLLSVPMNVYSRPDLDTKLSVLSCLAYVPPFVEGVPKTMYHVTTLSNFVRGYDKYSNTFSKTLIPESTFKDKFHLLTQDDIYIGVEKAMTLLQKLSIKDDTLVLLKTHIDHSTNLVKSESGRGYYVQSPMIRLTDQLLMKDLNIDTSLEKENYVDQFASVQLESLVARSFKLNQHKFVNYPEIIPRTVSILPISKGCQAKCSFCFSHSSVSEDTKQLKLTLDYTEKILRLAKDRGAERAVITGGGEPTLLPHDKVLDYICLCKRYYDKVVMITNGYVLSNNKITEDERLSKLLDYQTAGLNVLSISRHGFDEKTNTNIMNLGTSAEKVAKTLSQNKDRFTTLRSRWVCVLQKGGVESVETLEAYLDWVVQTDVSQVCFKELYVAVSEESVYYDSKYNIYSRAHQVPLDLVVSYLDMQKATVVSRLPWGSPVYEYVYKQKKLQIACYTEPSLFWERYNGVCRSWNIMADRKVYVSLEDLNSDISSSF